jgi:hypothetical protein
VEGFAFLKNLDLHRKAIFHLDDATDCVSFSKSARLEEIPRKARTHQVWVLLFCGEGQPALTVWAFLNCATASGSKRTAFPTFRKGRRFSLIQASTVLSETESSRAT